MAASPERETIIRFSPAEPHLAYVYTTEPAIHRRLTKAGYEPTRIERGANHSPRGYFYEVSRKIVLIRARVPPKRKHIENSPLQRANLARKGIL